MIFSWFKPYKILDRYTFNVVFLIHQTSDKRLLGKNGDGVIFLIEFKT